MGWKGIVTNAGAAMLAQIAGGGHTLTILDATAGTGTRNESDMAAATALVAERCTITIAEKQIRSDCVKIWTRITPQSTGYTAKEIGVWAKVDNGARTLFAIHQNTDGIVIPPADQDPNFIFDLICTYAPSNTDNIAVTVDPTSAVTQAQIADVLRSCEQHLSSEDIAQIRENLQMTERELFGLSRELIMQTDVASASVVYPEQPGIYIFNGSTQGLPDELSSKSGILLIFKCGSWYVHFAFATQIAYWGFKTSNGAPVWRRILLRGDGSATTGALTYKPSSGNVKRSALNAYSEMITIGAHVTDISSLNTLIVFSIGSETYRPAASTVLVNGYVVSGGNVIPAYFSISNSGNISLNTNVQQSSITEFFFAGCYPAK